MHIEIELKKQGQNFSEQWSFILQLLRSLEFVEYVKTDENVPIVQSPISDFLLQGSTMSQQDEAFYEQKQKHFQAWK